MLKNRNKLNSYFEYQFANNANVDLINFLSRYTRNTNDLFFVLEKERSRTKTKILDTQYLIDRIKRNPKHEFFVSIATSNKPGNETRLVDSNIFGIKALVVDLDPAGDKLHINLRQVEKEIKVLFEGTDFADNGFRPHFVVMSGRGVHLWYFIDPLNLLSKQYREQVKTMHRDAAKLLKQYIQARFDRYTLEHNLKELQKLKVDTAVGNYKQRMRIPGTYNPRVNRNAKIVLDYHYLQNMPLSLIFNELKGDKPQTTLKNNIRKAEVDDWVIEKIHKPRLQDTLTLQELRRDFTGSRNILISNFIFIHAQMGYELSEITQKTFKFNDNFKYKLNYGEVRSTIQSVIKTPSVNYKIKNESMFNFLGIEPEEEKHMITLKSEEIRKEEQYNTKREKQLIRRAKQKIKTYETKMKLIQKLNEDYDSGNYTRAELARIYKISPRTIDNYLNPDYELKKPTKRDYEYASRT